MRCTPDLHLVAVKSGWSSYGAEKIKCFIHIHVQYFINVLLIESNVELSSCVKRSFLNKLHIRHVHLAKIASQQHYILHHHNFHNVLLPCWGSTLKESTLVYPLLPIPTFEKKVFESDPTIQYMLLDLNEDFDQSEIDRFQPFYRCIPTLIFCVLQHHLGIHIFSRIFESVWEMSVDSFPEPDTPVTTTNRPNGMCTSMCFRLFSDACSTEITGRSATSHVLFSGIVTWRLAANIELSLLWIS